MRLERNPPMQDELFRLTYSAAMRSQAGSMLRRCTAIRCGSSGGRESTSRVETIDQTSVSGHGNDCFFIGFDASWPIKKMPPGCVAKPRTGQKFGWS